MEFRVSNVNEAFKTIVEGIYTSEIPIVEEESRAGKVLRIPEPVLIEYRYPLERVLFNPARDANPFFHVFESLWMLAGKNDVGTLEKYSSDIGKIASDDGVIFNGAYGYRWRHAALSAANPGIENKWGEGVDQLDILISHLIRNPESRRAVLQMWNVEDDLFKIETSKDICCNTAVYFSIRRQDGKFGPKVLDMTVTNRSNDLIWGCLGANNVHFSFLQEYVAAKVGAFVGKYYQFTNNLHVYEKVWEPEKWLSVYENRNLHSPIIDYTDRIKSLVPLYDKNLEVELNLFVSMLSGNPFDGQWFNRFFADVAYPMFRTFKAHKARNYLLALDWCEKIVADDWKQVCKTWILRRKRGYEKRNGTEAK